MKKPMEKPKLLDITCMARSLKKGMLCMTRGGDIVRYDGPATKKSPNSRVFNRFGDWYSIFHGSTACGRTNFREGRYLDVIFTFPRDLYPYLYNLAPEGDIPKPTDVYRAINTRLKNGELAIYNMKTAMMEKMEPPALREALLCLLWHHREAKTFQPAHRPGPPSREAKPRKKEEKVDLLTGQTPSQARADWEAEQKRVMEQAEQAFEGAKAQADPIPEENTVMLLKPSTPGEMKVAEPGQEYRLVEVKPVVATVQNVRFGSCPVSIHPSPRNTGGVYVLIGREWKQDMDMSLLTGPDLDRLIRELQMVRKAL